MVNFQRYYDIYFTGTLKHVPLDPQDEDVIGVYNEKYDILPFWGVVYVILPFWGTVYDILPIWGHVRHPSLVSLPGFPSLPFFPFPCPLTPLRFVNRICEQSL